MEQGAEMALRSETKDGENIWLRSSCAAPVQGVGGERGQEWLYDTFIRTRDGGQVGCHAMVLAASSPVLRKALEDANNDSEEPAMVLMPYNYLEDITNLLTLLYTGTCNQTVELNSLVTLLNVDPVKVKEQVRLKPEKVVVKLAHDVKDEPKEETEEIEPLEYEQETSSYWNRMAQVKTRYSSDDESDSDDSDDETWDDGYSGYDSDFVERKMKSERKIKTENGSRTKRPRKEKKVKYDEDGNEIPPTPRLKEHICEECAGTFKTKKELLNHRKSKHGYNPPKPERIKINCEVCWKAIDKGSLKSHMSSHTTEKNVSCPECGKKFKNERSLKPHLLIHQGIQNYHCEECGQAFFTQPALINHRKNKHTTDQIVICQECSKECRNKYELARHMKTHTGEREHECRHEGCGKRFIHAQTRDIHEKIHKGIKEYQCTICVKQFTQKAQLTVHMKRHMGIKDHECGVCGRAYVEPAGARKCCHSKKDSTKGKHTWVNRSGGNPRESVPTPREAGSMSRDSHPMSRENLPMSRDSLPMSRDGLPMSRDGLPMSRDTPPMSRDGHPMSRDGHPMARDGLAMSHDGLPMPRDGLSMPRDGLAMMREGLHIPREGPPMPRESLPMSREGFPIRFPDGLPMPRPEYLFGHHTSPRP